MKQLENGASRIVLSQLSKHAIFGTVVATVKTASETYETSQNTVGDILGPLVYLASELVLDVKSRTKKADDNVTTASDWIKWLNPNITKSATFARQLSRLTLSATIRGLFANCKTLDDYKDTVHNRKLYTFKAWRDAAAGGDTGTKNVTLTELYEMSPSALRRHFKKTYEKAQDDKLANDLKVRKIQVEVLSLITDKRKENRAEAKKHGSRNANVHGGNHGTGKIARAMKAVRDQATV